jgi:hypothetical protein
MILRVIPFVTTAEIHSRYRQRHVDHQPSPKPTTIIHIVGCVPDNENCRFLFI